MTAARSPALAGLRVLVVEDEMLISLLIEEALANEDCVVVGPFDRVAVALVAARTVQLDVAVLDVNVAGVKIYPVAEALEERGIPFLFLSGYGKNAVPDDRPGWHVCDKPFKPEDLLAMIARIAAFRQRA